MGQKEDLTAKLQGIPLFDPSAFAGIDRAKRIKSLLIVSEPTGLTSLDLREITNNFFLEGAIGLDVRNWPHILSGLLACLPNGAILRDFKDNAWHEALEIGQSYAEANEYLFSNSRIAEVAAAGERIHSQGFIINAREDCYEFAPGEIERASKMVRSNLEQIGPGAALGNIFGCLDRIYGQDYGMYLIGRRYATGDGSRRPSFPFAYLLNIVVNCLFPKKAPDNPSKLWADALNLSRDIIACLNIEPYYNLAYQIGLDPTNLMKSLREIALYDHLFTLRQWRFSFTGKFTKTFFDDERLNNFEASVGWGPADVIELWKATTYFATSDPNLIVLPALVSAGMKKSKLDLMLPYFAHEQGAVNAGYDSPFAAAKTYNLSFKPFIRHGPLHLLLPGVPLMGPAFFEAMMSAVRAAIGSDATSHLVGDGTERVAQLIFNDATMNATRIASKYSVSGVEDGECDLVLESDKSILFVECKAKPLTRAAMSGIHSEAFLDFAGGMFAAQKQALRHERILRQNGSINFNDGSVLNLNGRRVYRLALTLIEQGALQDRMLFRSLFEALSRSELRFDAEYSKAKKITLLNEELNELRYEVQKMIEVGVEPVEMTRYSASFSLGQLEACIEDYKGDLDAFCRAISIPMTYGALNPLAELHHFRDLERIRPDAR